VFKQKSDPTAATAPIDAVQQARTRARQRLIGAIVLLAIGIIGFPLVFETQPRPIPIDIPIEIPKRDALPPLAAPPASAPPARPSAETSSDGDRARALLEGRPVAAASAEAPRFVVQVGAFADAEAARETRQKAEKLGLKTYTQVAQTSAGSRIRVRIGPFTSRADADAALAKASAAGLTAVVLTL